MRVFVGMTVSELTDLVAVGRLRPPPVVGYAVTPAVREWYLDDNLEELEYAAFTDAARASLARLADSDEPEPPRRVVLAVDVSDDAATPDAGLGRSGVRVDELVQLDAVAAAHVDDIDAEPVVLEAVRAWPRARAGDADAGFVVDETFGHELLWYARQELADLVRDLGR